ncbi:Protein of unknown function [Ruminococcaceae bacterium YRB3002]|nr:Protein of unknown function [Ruminococcaceae bacterium YRB3002]
MLYDRSIEQLFFSKDQYLSDEEYSEIKQKYDEFLKEVLVTDVREMNKKLYGIDEPERSGGAKVFYYIIGGCFLAAFVGAVVALVMKSLLIFGYIFAGIFLVGGILSLITPSVSDMDTRSTSQRYTIRAWAVLMIALALDALVFIFIRDRLTSAELMVYLISTMFAICGIFLCVFAFLNRIMNIKIYSLEVPARCTGYVRRVDYEQRSSGRGRFTEIYTSPLFEYQVNGRAYESVYDVFSYGKDSDISLGETVPIRVDPKEPANVGNPKNRKVSWAVPMIIMGILFACAGFGLIFYAAAGNIKDLTVETSWNALVDGGGETSAAETTLIAITDDIVESSYGAAIAGRDWYIEKAVVHTVSRYEDKVIVSFEDYGFRELLFEPDNAPVKGDELYLMYTLNDDHENMANAYKEVFTYFRADEAQYAGNHTAFAG